MRTINEYYKPRAVDTEILSEDVARFAMTVMGLLDMLKLPDGQYRVVGSMVAVLNGIVLPELPEFPGSPILKKRPGDLDVLVTADLFGQLLDDGQTPSGIPVMPRLFDNKNIKNVLLIAAEDVPVDMSVDIINGNDRRNPKKYNRTVTDERYELLGDHKIHTLGGHIRELDNRKVTLKTFQDRQAIYKQVGI